jgi:AbrB family looped-hinge helix DNA binding protein
MTSKGQVTVPLAIRRQLGIGPGDRLSFSVREDGVLEVVPETSDLLSLAGSVKPRVSGVTLEDMEAAIAEGACGAWSRSIPMRSSDFSSPTMQSNTVKWLPS